jgi:hypothetical protein
MVGTARYAVRTPQRGVPTTSDERFSSTRSLTCGIRNLNAEQDHDFGGGGCRTSHRPNGVLRAIVHPRQRAKSKGLSTALLCQQDVLCHVAKEYSSFVPTARQEWFGIGDKCHMRADGICGSAKSRIGRSVGNQN